MTCTQWRRKGRRLSDIYNMDTSTLWGKTFENVRAAVVKAAQDLGKSEYDAEQFYISVWGDFKEEALFDPMVKSADVLVRQSATNECEDHARIGRHSYNIRRWMETHGLVEGLSHIILQALDSEIEFQIELANAIQRPVIAV